MKNHTVIGASLLPARFGCRGFSRDAAVTWSLMPWWRAMSAQLHSISLEPWEGPGLGCQVCSATSLMYADTKARSDTWTGGGFAPIVLHTAAHTRDWSLSLSSDILWLRCISAAPGLRSEVLSKWEGGQYLLGDGPAHSPHLPPLRASQESSWQHNSWLHKRDLMGPNES